MIRIARTEGTTITNSATVMAADESPFEMEKVWIAAMDDRVRPDHAEMNFVKVGQYAKFIVGGEELDYPGDIDASAGQRINCRCAVSLIGKRDSNGNLIPKGN